MLEAYKLDSAQIKNSTQLCRTIQKLAANPPQDNELIWTDKMRQALKRHCWTWNKMQKTLNKPMDRIPPLNIMGVLDLEIITREWHEPNKTISKGNQLIKEIDSLAIPAQTEFLTLLMTTELKDDYDFDAYYRSCKNLFNKNHNIKFS